MTTLLLDHLRRRMEGARKLLVPYLMTGIPDRVSFPAAFAAAAQHADAVELGLPYSDPLMDGPVISAAGDRVIREGLGPLTALDMAADLGSEVPKLAMTYYNPIHSLGEKEFCARAAAVGIAGLIVPDLPVEESKTLRSAAAAQGLAWIPLVAPTSSPERVELITATATGFVYAVSTLGVTGTREALSERAARVVESCRRATDMPILVGIGVSDADQAVSAAGSADGVVIGSAVVRTVLEEGAGEMGDFLAGVRSALDRMSG